MTCVSSIDCHLWPHTIRREDPSDDKRARSGCPGPGMSSPGASAAEHGHDGAKEHGFCPMAEQAHRNEDGLDGALADQSKKDLQKAIAVIFPYT